MAEPGGVRFGAAYFGNRYPGHARRDLAEIAAAGFDFVVHVMSEEDLRWNPETVGRLVSIGRDLGLAAWLTPWGLGGVFGGEAASYAVAERPEAVQRDNRGARLPALCPRQPAFRTLVEDWLEAAAASGAEVVQWDEPHLALPHRGTPERWACRCAACLEAFRAERDAPMPTVLTPEVAAFADDLLTGSLAWMIEAAAARGLASSVVLLAEDDADPAHWRAIAALPGVRSFGCTPYWLYYGVPPTEMDAFVRRWGERIAAATAGTGAEPLGWVQAFQVPAGREPEIERATAELIGAGMESVAFWAYRACEAMSRLAADDPAAAWAAVVRAVGDARRDGRA